MPPRPLVDFSLIDLGRVEDDLEGIRKFNQQRFEMEMLSGIIKYDRAGGYVVAFRDTSMHDFWVRGHIPGRPIMPGVLICECAAQACSYFYGRSAMADMKGRFMGFAGLDGVRFRGQVLPGDRLIMVAKLRGEMNTRISSFDCQGFVKERMVFDGAINGVII
jgi:3-hydroxyacyl-[acyl-carrier-protein] dehydratase